VSFKKTKFQNQFGLCIVGNITKKLKLRIFKAIADDFMIAIKRLASTPQHEKIRFIVKKEFTV
jgi:hypothetical protein